jgi:Sec-independent protein translocase protein TatA
VNLGFGQLIIIMLLGLLLFGDLPKILKNLTTSLQTLKKGLKDNQDENK